MLTPQIIADTLNGLGIDSPAKLTAFLAPAALSVERSKCEAQIAAHDAETRQIMEQRDAAKAALESKLEEARQRFVGGAN